ncbi:MAG: putative toxin-antitoxin system toxin component, PIN family [Rhodospirillales bacterium]|nr:putative toxin-antitoxin system toxin component, PIN family [Rhodospirillales bacterium]
MRAVFDTDVVLSALIFGRRLTWLRLAWAEGTVTPIVCRETVTELLRVLAYPKFRLDRAEREALLAEYLPFAETVRLPDAPPDLPLACRDRDDVVFLRLALASRAELLVSGDKDLTVLASAWSVVSPAGLRQRLSPDANPARDTKRPKGRK